MASRKPDDEHKTDENTSDTDRVDDTLNVQADHDSVAIGGIHIRGDVSGNVIVGDNNTVDQTIIQRIFNIFRSEAEAVEQRNRRIMLGHVENFWVKGVLEKSLHGAALLELGFKEDSSAVNYPWTIKKESTNETLSAGKSMLDIYQEIGLGRSLLILGAPGSGKTTMLLELARQLIERARRDETEPIPVVFNLASWKEKQTLADWLAEQLNIVYFVPKKTSPVWVYENRMSLLLDGLDEVRADRRAECVEAINVFRKEHGLTSLIVCCRIEEYALVNTKLALDGAIALQPLTSKQVNAYFERFGKRLATVKQMLKKDKALQELAETPLVLSVMTLAYKDIQADDLVVLGNLNEQRRHLFDTYIARMFERSGRFEQVPFTKEQTIHYLSGLARTMTQHNLITYQIEAMQPSWLNQRSLERFYRIYCGLTAGLSGGLIFAAVIGLFSGPMVGLSSGLIFGLLSGLWSVSTKRIVMVDRLKWSWEEVRGGLSVGLGGGLIIGLVFSLVSGLLGVLLGWLIGGVIYGLIFGLIFGLTSEQIEETTYSGQRLKQTLLNSLLSILILGLIVGLSFWLPAPYAVSVSASPATWLSFLMDWGMSFGLSYEMSFGLALGLISSLIMGVIFALIFGLSRGLNLGYFPLIQHYSLRMILIRYQFLPRRLTAFLEYCVGLIFLRRVGGSYIFIHRLIMEHFAEMDV